MVNKFEKTFTIHFRLINMLLSALESPSSQEQTDMLFEIRFLNAPLTLNNFLSRAPDFYNPSCNFRVKELFSSPWGNTRGGMGAEVLEPPAFGTSVLLKISPYSRPFLLHVPFNTVPSQPSIRRSIWTVVHSSGYFDWVCCTSSMSIYICQYTRNDKVTDDMALLGGYKYDCCMFLSNSDHQVRIQDLAIFNILKLQNLKSWKKSSKYLLRTKIELAEAKGYSWRSK